MTKNTENGEVRANYGRSVTMASNNNNGVKVMYGNDNAGVLIVKGNGTINSRGVVPDGSMSSLLYTQTEVEFTIDIYKKGNGYQGNIYLVSYDTRKKINSNKLKYFAQPTCDEIICIFEVKFQKGCQTCTYDLFVTLSPTCCQNNTPGALFAYAAPIYNEGVNIGGALESGEIIFYAECNGDCHKCCECGNG